ncbi:DEAD/DEAH box helicase [Cellulomonas sp. PhB143]|uniref:DEAD/DEAH box helicase n=1 Tax=Cellulomonas sp. PhB143 TaxID=2485186 RepID=UPI000F467C95|nr:DEAD/DEAH box helicase [Cellulomonas sp. PhB143]ROS76854.1 superfamily II DNA/RNA helicase [Cellulomonas sp. PhB143]
MTTTTSDESIVDPENVVETVEEAVAAAAPGTTSSSIQAADVTFADFAVRPEIVEALAEKGIVAPFPIQAMTLPVALSGHDIIGQAKTGTGKTLGFGVPLLNRVVAPGEPEFDLLPAPGKPQALVIAPTRELASQVARDLETASTKRSVRVLQVYGGRAYEPQVEALQRGVEVVVGTPGRMLDLLNQGHLDLTRASTVVLDEADEMLDLGFLPDVEKILARTPAKRHTMLFSATMPGAVVSMARRYMSQPTHIRANDPDDGGQTVKNIEQVVYRAHALDKVEVLARILQSEGRGRTIVFARTKRTAAKVSDELRDRGFAAGAIHGDLGQGAREQALRAFRNNKIDVLVATDVAARGIDVDDVTHVVNYQCPEDERTYLHRTGRTGRAGNKGTAVTFVDWDDTPRWGLIDKALELGIPEPKETYSTSPHLYTELHIPAGTTGRLPRSKRTHAGLDAEVLEDLGETGKHAGGAPSRGGRDGGRDGARDHGRSGEGRGRSGEGRGGSDAGRGPAGQTATPEAGADGAPRRRSRRRTRGGRPADQQQGTDAAQTSAPATQPEG